MPVKSGPAGRLDLKLRLGRRAPPGLRINRLPFDESHGERWNAGGNKRGGGTARSLEGWLDELARWAEQGSRS